MGENKRKQSMDSVTRKWALLAGICTSPLFILFAYFGDPGREQAAWVCAISIVVAARFLWDLRTRVWFMGSTHARVVLDNDSTHSAPSYSPHHSHPMAAQAADLYCSSAGRSFEFCCCVRDYQARREHDRESSPRERIRAIVRINAAQTTGSLDDVCFRSRSVGLPVTWVLGPTCPGRTLIRSWATLITDFAAPSNPR